MSFFQKIDKNHVNVFDRNLYGNTPFSFPKFKNVSCTAGIEYCKIRMDGKIMRCNYYDFDTKLNLDNFKDNMAFFNDFSFNCAEMKCIRICEGTKIDVWKDQERIFNGVFWRKKVHKIEDIDKSNFFIELGLVQNCINNCQYCILKKFFNTGVKSFKEFKFIDVDKLIGFLNEIKTIKKGKKIISICGEGDSIFHPKCVEFINYSTENDFHVDFFTSGLFFHQKIKSFENKKNITLRISLHPTVKFWNEKKIMDLLCYCNGKFNNLTTTIVNHESNMQYIDNLREKITSLGIEFTILNYMEL